DVRVIAATNRDLKEMIDAGHFREDLYFRLNVFPVDSVPLRKRIEDVPLLARHFLHRACLKFNKQGVRIPPAQLELLTLYPWPGN
ncbi:sigma 54-interacting transcriptional regulator, partial [Pollutimonas sp. H1-120]|uniref:sigma 54-interacting transcriptional regulator n=1 Tax=Pollutimonas sp. H1-120 TaxID=3148824 RepID=UPI003B519B27